MYSFVITSTKNLTHGRNAAQLVYSLNPIKSSVYLEKEGRRINAKSILGLLSAGIVEGEKITVNINNENDFTEVKKIITEFFSKED